MLAIFQLIAWRKSLINQSIASLTCDCTPIFAELVEKDSCPIFKVINKAARITLKIREAIKSSANVNPLFLARNARG